MPTHPADDGTPLHYDVLSTEEGRRSPVVVLAGGPARHPAYLGNLAGLDAVRPLVVPHQRGVGQTPPPADATAGSWWSQAADVEALRTHLRLRRMHLAAHSAGAWLALAYTARFPDRIGALLLLDPPAQLVPGVVSDAPELLARRRGEPALEAALAAREAGPDLTGDEAFTAYNHRVAPLGYARWTLREQAHAAHGRWSADAARAYVAAEAPPDLLDRQRAVTAPVLVVGGAQDCVTGVAPPRALAEVFPTGRAVFLERCGHYPWIEQPAEFRRAVDPFLERADPRW